MARALEQLMKETKDNCTLYSHYNEDLRQFLVRTDLKSLSIKVLSGFMKQCCKSSHCNRSDKQYLTFSGFPKASTTKANLKYLHRD